MQRNFEISSLDSFQVIIEKPWWDSEALPLRNQYPEKEESRTPKETHSESTRLSDF